MALDRDDLLRIEVTDVYHFTGKRPWPAPFSLKALTGLKDCAGRYLLLFEWDAKATYFHLVAKAQVDRGASEALSDNASKAHELLAAHGVSRDNLPTYLRPEAELRPSKHFLIGEVAGEAQVTLTLSIDTDSPAYLRYAAELKQAEQARAGEAAALPSDPRLIVTAYARERGGQAVSQRPIRVLLTPARPMEPYGGYVALDLGNTTTTLASLDRKRDHANDIVINNPEGSRKTGVRLLAYKAAERPRAERGQAAPAAPMPAASFKIGEPAMRPGPGWLVLGAKRLLADPNRTAPHEMWLNNRRVEVPKRVPAELFITGMLKEFHARQRQRIARLAITCPTTFSDREQAQLKRVVYDALRRSLGWSEYKLDKDWLAKHIPLVLDEASAAAYFFLSRDFVDRPGGLRAFHHVHPHGLNVLLYDCGGGTTDISLVQAKARPVEDEVRRMEIEVLGRSGLRGFGGDNITAAAFCLLQAKIAAAIGGGPGAVPPMPQAQEVHRLPKYLKDHRAAIERRVPLSFDRHRVDHEDQRDRMDATMEMWLWAEEFKKALADERPVSVPYAQDSKLAALLAQANPSRTASDFQKLLDQQVKLHHSEVDELVRGEIDRSIDKANGVLESKLKGQDIHRVYVVGNASRYPLIRERIKERLKVRFLADEVREDGTGRPGRLIFDEENLKDAVAKGAVLALRASEEREGVAIHFDNKLIDRLPFDLTYRDRAGGEQRVLYAEHTRYQDLETTTIPTPPEQDGEAGRGRNLVTLRRRWPGETRGELFLEFVFDEPIKGPLEISYYRPEFAGDPGDDSPAALPHFKLRDTGGYGQEVVGVEEPEASYLSPPQEGQVRLPGSKPGEGGGHG